MKGKKKLPKFLTLLIRKASAPQCCGMTVQDQGRTVQVWAVNAQSHIGLPAAMDCFDNSSNCSRGSPYF